jgi:hypothetical protein
VGAGAVADFVEEPEVLARSLSFRMARSLPSRWAARVDERPVLEVLVDAALERVDGEEGEVQRGAARDHEVILRPQELASGGRHIM